jgi:glutathione synthase/RimK-type ligase-like ATP-grasp enzyme
MKKLALATYSGLPQLTESDVLVVEPLQELGIDAVATPWDDPEIDWHNFDGVIIRSTWNYHKNHDAFLDWIERLSSQDIRVWNPAEIITWNTDKIYLKQLEEAGIQIVPTEWIPKGSHERAHLSETLEKNGWDRAVLKPRVSASADGVSLISAANIEENEYKVREMNQLHDLMLQPLVEEIKNGEWSIMFINDEYSHSVLKLPDADSIYVQSELGGTWKVAEPSASLIEQAKKSINSAHEVTNVSEPFLFTRVDGVEVKGELQLMELELIEPELFFSVIPDAAIRFAKAIASKF